MTPLQRAERLHDDLRKLTPTLEALERATDYMDTAQESETRMMVDLSLFIDRHGLEAFERVCAVALESALDTALARAGMLR